MKISYSSNKLEKQLIDPRLLKKVYGRLAPRINDVLDELIVAETLDDIPEAPPDRRHKMTNVPYTWSIDLNKNYRMWVRSEGENDPKFVTVVEIVEILDDH